MSWKFVELLLVVFSFNVGDMPDFVHDLHEVLGQSVCLWVLRAYNHDVYSDPLHVLVVIVVTISGKP